MVTLYGDIMDSAFTTGTSVVAIYTYGCMVWPSEEPWNGSGIGPEVHPGDYYISWTPTTVTGSFSIGGNTYRLESYSGYFNDFDGRITANAFSHTGIGTLDTNAIYIGVSAFQNCNSLSSVSLSYAYTIDNSAFLGCGALESISLSRCETIGTKAFYMCGSLHNIVLKECSYIGSSAFRGTGSYKTITLGYPDVVEMGSSAIEGQTVYKLNVPAYLVSNYENSSWAEKMTGYPDVLNISGFHDLSYPGYYSWYLSGSYLYGSEFSTSDISTFETNATAVDGCHSMTSLIDVHMPYCEIIAGNAFDGCTNLQTVITSSVVYDIGGYAFRSCYSLEYINLRPWAIRKNAFEGCSSLEVFTTSSFCYVIESSAFKNCINLSFFKVGADFSSTCHLYGSLVFEGCTNLQSIYVPKSLLSAYKSASGWSYFSDIIYSY